MNERIFELLIEAGGWYGGENHLTGETRVYTDDVDYKKFAELIVRECAEQIRLQGTDWIDWQPSQQGIRSEYVAMAEHIKQHFGVKERMIDEKRYEWEVYYNGVLLGRTNTEGRHQLVNEKVEPPIDITLIENRLVKKHFGVEE
jgi:hypothetical protein